jgi:hypothetical protein
MIEQGGLADAGLAPKDYHPASRLANIVQKSIEKRALGCAAVEHDTNSNYRRERPGRPLVRTGAAITTTPSTSTPATMFPPLNLGNGVTDLEVAGATLREMVRMQLALGPHAARTPRTSHTRCLDRNAA